MKIQKELEMSRYASIIATGRFVPPIERSNIEMAAAFGAVIGKFEASTGITRRFYAPETWATSDVAFEACKDALAKAGLKPEDLDMIILGTDSPDYITPATSVVVQHKLSAKNAGTFDVGCACASFPTWLANPSVIIASIPSLKTIVVIGVYLMHKLADPKDPMIFFYGD